MSAVSLLATAAPDAPLKTGGVLPNATGAIALLVSPVAADGSVVVLATVHHEFVTWRARPDGSDTVWGHYTFDLGEALADYAGRCAE